MLRTNSCGELSINNLGEKVTLCGWVQKKRDLGGMTFIDLRDRYGITQLAFNMEKNHELCDLARKLSREFVIQITGVVIERSNKNNKISTGDIEINVSNLIILNSSENPPFTIEDETDGGDDLRMQYRYLDIRRSVLKNNLILRHKISTEARNYLNEKKFIEVETPYLIKSTPEGARDFVVPSRMNKNQFYALPQSPQTFKQLIMVGGMDRYYQIVKCFRDEDLRSDRQPEFTQIDCEMSFVEQEDILNTFEGLIAHLIQCIHNIEMPKFHRITYKEAIQKYGTDKPDMRFGMKLVELNDLCQQNNFKIFDDAELIVGINVKKGANFTRKKIDQISELVKSQKIGGKGLIYCKYNTDGSFKSSVDKFFSEEDLMNWANAMKSAPGDLILIISGEKNATRKSMGLLRIQLAKELGLRTPKKFAAVWVVDFPLLEWNEETQRFHAMHHPFTSPKEKDIPKLDKSPEKVLANAYDLVLNGSEIGGGSIRIHDPILQKKMLNLLGFSKKEAKNQFGFLIDSFKYGAPPHGGIAFGFDRLCAILGGDENIRDFIAFPKNNSGRDTMINSPSLIDDQQLNDLNIKLKA